jgi:PAS domain S-box-containing protein
VTVEAAGVTATTEAICTSAVEPVESNRAALELMDYESEEQIMGKICHDSLCPAQKDQCPVLDLGQDIDMSRRTLITRHGKKIPILKSVVYTHLDGQPVLLEAFVDITERQQAEQALQESQQFLQLVIDNIPQTIFWKDEQSVYLGCNQRFAAEHGFSSPADVVGKTDYDLVQDKEKADSFRQMDRRVMDSAAPELHVIQSELQADGQQTWIDSNKIPLNDAEGNVIGILSTCEDITERMQTEKELLRLHRAVEQTTDGIAMFDLDGNIQFANPAWAHMHGYELHEIQNENMVLFHTPEQLQHEVMPCRQQVLETGAHHCQIGHVKKDQSVFPTMMSNTLLKDEDGEPIGLVATARDITRQMQAEQELQQQSQMLQGVARAAEQLLTIPHPVQAINTALATLGATTGADRVYVF